MRWPLRLSKGPTMSDFPSTFPLSLQASGLVPKACSRFGWGFVLHLGLLL